jgi:signal transduction histidine kinase
MVGVILRICIYWHETVLFLRWFAIFFIPCIGMIQSNTHTLLIARFLILFAIIFAGPGRLSGQPDRVQDSLRHELLIHPQLDSVHIGLIMAYGKTFIGRSSDSVRVYGAKVLNLAEYIGNSRLMVGGYSMLGISYTMKNENIEQATDYFYKALDIARQHQGDQWRNQEGRMLINLSGVNLLLKRYDAAFENYRAAIPLFERTKDSTRLADSYQAWGMVYEAAGKLDSALLCFNTALTMHVQNRNRQGVLTLRANLGDLYKDRLQYQDAVEAYSYCLANTDSVAHPRTYADLLARLGIAYSAMGQPAKAIACLKQSLAMPVRQVDDDGSDLLRDLASAFLKSGEPDSAYYYLDRYVQWAQQHFDQEKTRQFFEIESKYKIREAERENKILSEEKAWANTQSKFLLAGLMLLLILLAVSYYFIRRLRSGKRIIEAQRNQLDVLLTDVTKANQLLQELSTEKQFMVSILAHDLRSPLSNVRTGTALLKKWSADEKWSEILDRIDRSAGKIQTMINRIMEVEQADKSIGQAGISRVDLKAAAHLAVSHYADAAALGSVHLDIRQPNVSLFVRADPGLLEQVIGNLIVNAIRFSPGNGRVELRLEWGVGEIAVLTVSDEGPGIAVEDRELIFRKYYSVDGHGERNGMRGLGLYFVKQYLEQIGGRVAVDSAPGGGSVFTVHIPLAGLND